MHNEPIAHLVWLQGRRAADDVEDYYEVARPGDKSVDGSEPFPVFSAPPAAVQEPVAVKALDDLLLIPKDLTDEEWREIKYNVDRKANPDIPLWRIQETVKYANFIAGHRGRAMLDAALSPSQSDPAPDAPAGFATALLETIPQHRDTDAAIRLGAAVLARIEDQAVREIAIRNALTAAAVDVSHSASAAPEMASPAIEERIATVADCNAAFDPADEAFGGAFRDGFREGWLFAKSPDFEDREEAEEDYPREVDMAPTECWDAYRSHYFAKLPLAAIPQVGSVISPTPASDIAALREENERLKRATVEISTELFKVATEMAPLPSGLPHFQFNDLFNGLRIRMPETEIAFAPQQEEAGE